MGIEDEVGPRRRAWFGQVRAGEGLEEAPGRCGVARGLQGHPVGLRLHMPRDDVLDRTRHELEEDENQQRGRDRARTPHPALAPRQALDQVGARNRKERVPGEAFRQMRAGVMPVLMGDDDLNLPVCEARVEERVPEDDSAARPKSDRVGVDRFRLIADLLETNRDVRNALVDRDLMRLGPELLIGKPLQLTGGQVREDKQEESRDADERRTSGDPPVPAEYPGKPHDDCQGERKEEKLAHEQQPVREDELGEVPPDEIVTALPPEADDLERDLDEPDDCEAEHSEQHPGAHPSGRRLAGKALSSQGVRDERADECHLRGDEIPACHALEVSRPIEHASRKEPPLVELRQFQVPRNPAATPEEVGGNGPCPCERG